MAFEFANWRYMTESGLVVRGPVLLYSITGTVSVNGEVGTVYEGMDAASGQVLAIVTALTDTEFPMSFNPPAFMERGIYLTAGANMEFMLFTYRVVDDDPFKLENPD